MQDKLGTFSFIHEGEFNAFAIPSFYELPCPAARFAKFLPSFFLLLSSSVKLVGVSLGLDSALFVSELPLHRKGAAICSGNDFVGVVKTMVFFSDVLQDGQEEGVRSWSRKRGAGGGEASACGFNYKKGIKAPILASGVESDINKLMFHCGN